MLGSGVTGFSGDVMGIFQNHGTKRERWGRYLEDAHVMLFGFPTWIISFPLKTEMTTFPYQYAPMPLTTSTEPLLESPPCDE